MNWAEHNLVRVGDVLQVVAWQEYDWLIQGFSLRSAGNVGYRFGDVGPAREEIAKTLDFDVDCWTGMQQIHDNRVEIVEAEDVGRGSHDFESGYPDTDGLITKQKNAVLAVVVADCVPLLLVDPVQRIVGLAHAGRKGTQASISKTIVNQMVKYGSRSKDIQAAIGPSIGPCCYEIDRETHEHFDLWGENERQLQEAGVGTIIRTNVCTKEHNDLFFSHRADAEPGRFAGIIGLS